MKQLNLTERQEQTDEQGGHGGSVQKYFEGQFKDYGVTYVSVVVVGQRYRGTRVEIVYAITVDSKLAIPHALQGKSRTGPTGDRFSYSQLANSVYTSSLLDGADRDLRRERPADGASPLAARGRRDRSREWLAARTGAHTRLLS